jgi:hypothetical protein
MDMLVKLMKILMIITEGIMREFMIKILKIRTRIRIQMIYITIDIKLTEIN